MTDRTEAFLRIGSLHTRLGKLHARLTSLEKRVRQLEEEVVRVEAIVAGFQATVDEQAEDPVALCIQAANLAFFNPETESGHRDTFRLASDTLFCQQQGPQHQLDQQMGILAKLRSDLLKHKIAQGVLMSTLIYAFTRPGFLQGIGEIIPG